MEVYSEFERAWARGSDRLASSLLLCVYTGSVLPDFCQPMHRDPRPAVGMLWGPDFAEAYQFALATNSAVHDGAVGIGRTDAQSPYRITAWSLRLFPPSEERIVEPNRGSAFNSCLAMSVVHGVDRMYLVTTGQLVRFDAGAFQIVNQDNT